MKTRFLFAVALAFAPLAWSADPAPAAQPPPITDEQIVAQFRSDLMAKRADIMAKGLTLTADEAAKFWPLFGTFQKEQDVIVNERIKWLAKFQTVLSSKMAARAIQLDRRLGQVAQVQISQRVPLVR